MKLKTLLLTAMAIMASVFAKANSTPGTGEETIKKQDLLGGVYNSDTKKPLGNVAVTAYRITSKKEQMVVTDANGNYSFDDLQPGAYKFVFAKDGYKKVTKDKVQIKPDEGFHMNVEMTEHSSFDYMPGPFHFLSYE
jgi:uncharacterized surface anchored protein